MRHLRPGKAVGSQGGRGGKPGSHPVGSALVDGSEQRFDVHDRCPVDCFEMVDLDAVNILGDDPHPV